ncbi:5'-methylthioadenosine/adenosylhomocysteine nucleosidase [Verticiella sediminum]|uniref:adenosylhomocysteine nucleosidase n=1 Tax=Verticiella sediminum TaxID=1247510 RepID=A0A556AYL0_9BURK|nr:5'-methylthioadenosine/adenosylhomocysteine nucleosidase [Verticiella sediminum]TSH98021.1 5'-methylthioadenosine/adenosylhomocysteine nucleosidase [Verticiella sediminum]
MPTLAILAAMPDEIQALLAAMTGPRRHLIGRREFHEGAIEGVDCVIAMARIGKAAAAATTVTLIREFDADAVLVAGLAGGVHAEVRVGDVVVADTLMQYDLDASPIFPPYEVPLLGMTRFGACPELSGMLRRSADRFLAQDAAGAIAAASEGRLRLDAPRTHRGLIATGDRFVKCEQTMAAVRAAAPDALCVEMEGAAVAQVCHEFERPFAVIRTISDRADTTADADFSVFLTQGAGAYASGILPGVVRDWGAAHAKAGPPPPAR